MPSIFWAIRWKWGVFTMNTEVETALCAAIRQRLFGQTLSPKDIGLTLADLSARYRNSTIQFSADLRRIDPPSSIRIGADTDIHIGLAQFGETPLPDLEGHDPGPSPTSELADFVMWKVTFKPSRTDRDYEEIYESLIGIGKEVILDEMIAMLIPPEARARWSERHYGAIVPILRTTTGKAPVIVLGGDPGTGKTALATSIGAPLCRRLGETVHFRHMSLLMRGMGYHGRASSMIVKAFEQIKDEYTRLREPMILFFDEAEAIVGSRRLQDVSSGSQQDIAIVDAIIVGVDSLRKGMQARVIALFATNLTGHVDAALMRRCYYHRFERPDEQTRRALFEACVRGLDITSEGLEALVSATTPRKTEGTEIPFTHSDIVEQIVGRAVEAAIRQDERVTLGLLLKYCRRAVPTGFFER